MITTGIDIQILDEVTESYATFGDRYLRRLFSERELAGCDTSHSTFTKSLAARFAGKEAVLKALEPHDHIPPWRSIEVVLDARGTPTVLLSGDSMKLALQRGVQVLHLSIGYGLEYAIAVVVADIAER